MRIYPPRIKPGAAGFTLVEILVALLLISILSMLLARILQGSLRIHRLQKDSAPRREALRHQRILQFSGESDEPAVTLVPLEPEP